MEDMIDFRSVRERKRAADLEKALIARQRALDIARIQEDREYEKEWFVRMEASTTGYTGDKYFLPRPPVGSSAELIHAYAKRVYIKMQEDFDLRQHADTAMGKFEFKKRMMNPATRRYLTEDEQRTKHRNRCDEMHAEIWHRDCRNGGVFPGDRYGMVRPSLGYDNMTKYMELANRRFMEQYRKLPVPEAPPEPRPKSAHKLRRRTAPQKKERQRTPEDPERVRAREKAVAEQMRERRGQVAEWTAMNSFPGDQMFVHGPQQPPLGRPRGDTDQDINFYFQDMAHFRREQELHEAAGVPMHASAKVKKPTAKKLPRVEVDVFQLPDQRATDATEAAAHVNRLELVAEWCQMKKYPGDEFGLPRPSADMAPDELKDYIDGLSSNIDELVKATDVKKKREAAAATKRARNEGIEKRRADYQTKTQEELAPKRAALEAARRAEGHKQSQPARPFTSPRPPSPKRKSLDLMQFSPEKSTPPEYGPTPEHRPTPEYRPTPDAPYRSPEYDKQFVAQETQRLHREAFDQRDNDRLRREMGDFHDKQRAHRMRNARRDRDRMNCATLLPGIPSLPLVDSPSPEPPSLTSRQYDPSRNYDALLTPTKKEYLRELKYGGAKKQLFPANPC